MASCNAKGNSKEEKDREKSKTQITPAATDLASVPLEDCIKKAIYYINEVDVTTYDSINTQYFHQVIDYTDTIAINAELELEKLTYILEVDGTQNFTNAELDSIIQKVNDLKSDLAFYKKSVTGYVFVHTFLNKADTMSAIIITNADRTRSEAIKIKTVTNIEPNYFKQKIRNIEK